MTQCADCRWWNPRPGRRDGVCGGIPTFWEWRFDQLDADEMAVMMDANAVLVTAPAFGCGLWEAEP